MNDITVSKRNYKNVKTKSTISKSFSKILLSIIFLLSSLIFTNTSNKNYSLYKKHILTNNFRYTKIKNLYEKYFGKIIPTKEVATKEVFNSKNNYTKIEDTSIGEKLYFDKKAIIEAIQSGIVVYIGEKDGIQNTVIVQGIDDTDIWYSNVINSELKLYDYVEKGQIIGEVENELIINIIKDNNHLKYEEYIKNI